MLIPKHTLSTLKDFSIKLFLCIKFIKRLLLQHFSNFFRKCHKIPKANLTKCKHRILSKGAMF